MGRRPIICKLLLLLLLLFFFFFKANPFSGDVEIAPARAHTHTHTHTQRYLEQPEADRTWVLPESSGVEVQGVGGTFLTALPAQEEEKRRRCAPKLLPRFPAFSKDPHSVIINSPPWQHIVFRSQQREFWL